jgi:hypothetical protein
MFNNFFPENLAVYEIMFTNMYGTDGQYTDGNTAHALSMPDN